MFTTVLVANRGAIATRIMRTLKRMNIRAVAVYAEADRDSLHLRLADQAISLGAGPVSETYLDREKIIAAARASGAEAIHPGYGFLSENPDFVEDCAAAGLVFIGPAAEQMRQFGLKHSARELARASGLPLLPGSDLLFSLAEAAATAREIGYPVMLKSTAGGGGIGMKICRNEAELQQAYDGVRRLGANNFSNDGVFLEKYIERARHIEVQVFGGGDGKAVAIGERDCSTQRRHQKVIEEAPAPDIDEGTRRSLHRSAVELMSSVNYANAGTVEFIYDQQDRQFYFLEVNTRLQVEHGVTEEVYGLDLVQWMLEQAAGEIGDLEARRAVLQPQGHAIQLRLYAEDPNRNFQPSTGLLCSVCWPEALDGLRIDHWIEAGLEVSPYFDPMLAKLIARADTREAAREKLLQALADTSIQGIETNALYLAEILSSRNFVDGRVHTRFLEDFSYCPPTLDVLSAGTMTTLQDYPGRVGYWDVGVPPSGPFDSLAFRLGNRLLGNPDDCAGLEITLNGPSLRFNRECRFILCGAPFAARLGERALEFWQVQQARTGDTLQLGKVRGAGARAYMLVEGGFEGHHYLGSRATFTLGQFGGFSGRALRAGDVLHLAAPAAAQDAPALSSLPPELCPDYAAPWELRVIPGPQGAPDFFTESDIENFFASDWEVHYNSSRTGIRLIGPKPEWARPSGGEAGMHPSNIHDNAYAVGAIDFTGDMPVILGPDGPSLGGFVCPATVIAADLWKLGQLKAGDKLRFVPLRWDEARQLDEEQSRTVATLEAPARPFVPDLHAAAEISPLVAELAAGEQGEAVRYRAAGDNYLLVEYGEMELDIRLRFRVHALMLHLQSLNHPAVLELTPGIRSLQVHFDSRQLTQTALLDLLQAAEDQLQNLEELRLPSRVVHLPLSWDDEACRLAIEKYMQSVRSDAPWCPSNIEFIRRINGLDSIEEVKRILFSADYVVMGLGDVYLGAPVATPLDPRHRLVTTKYNPARTWTAENSVGIGGSYLCVYGMEGPGGYQFVGRTLQMWNRYRRTVEFEQPWLLRFFDRIRFFEVTAEELVDIRERFPRGDYPLRIEEGEFSLKEYEDFLETNREDIETFTTARNRAFDEELQRWVESGQMNFESAADDPGPAAEQALPAGCEAVESQVAGSLWKWLVDEGDEVTEGEAIAVLESMKMEIEVHAPAPGRIRSLLKQPGQQLSTGQHLALLETAKEGAE